MLLRFLCGWMGRTVSAPTNFHILVALLDLHLSFSQRVFEWNKQSHTTLACDLGAAAAAALQLPVTFNWPYGSDGR